jgi:hypothetical protein
MAAAVRSSFFFVGRFWLTSGQPVQATAASTAPAQERTAAQGRLPEAVVCWRCGLTGTFGAVLTVRAAMVAQERNAHRIHGQQTVFTYAGGGGGAVARLAASARAAGRCRLVVWQRLLNGGAGIAEQSGVAGWWRWPSGWLSVLPVTAATAATAWSS